MAVFTADYEKGTNGNTIGTGDAGSATAWSSVATPGAYSNAQAAHGTLAALLPPTNSAPSLMTWTSPTDQFGRLYLYMNQLPGGSGEFDVVGVNGTGTTGVAIDKTSGIIFAKAAGGFSSNGPALSATTLYRIEFQIVPGSSGSVAVKVFAGDSTTQTGSTVTQSGNVGTVSSINFGNVSGGAAVAFRPTLDQLVASATAYPGPFPVSSTAPAVTGSTTIGSTLTCDGGSWNTNATFTLTYQWQRDVLGNTVYGNIASATSSTYTLVLLDDACNVRCVVTATGTQATNESVTANSNGILDTTAPSSGSQQGNLLLLGVG